MGQQGLIVNELLFNPVPGGADWVELYNNSDSPANLADVRLVRWVGDSLGRFYTLDSAVVAPHDYVVLTTDAAAVAANHRVQWPSKVLQVAAMPAYNDASGTVIVALADSTIIDRLDYTAAMHSPLLRDPEGVSLERRSPNRPTQEASNWFSASSTSGYGTPGYVNSQSTEFLFVENSFTLEPEIFSPDGDGYNDQLDITYQLDAADLAANITIYDAVGRRVRLLARGALLGSHGVLTWNGLDDKGLRCRPGNYVVIVEAYNTEGRTQVLRRVVALALN